MPKITLNGEVYEARGDQTIIQVADEVGVRIPRYCYHPDIGIEGSCRMCLVEADGVPKLMPSCATPVRDGLVVRFSAAFGVANQAPEVMIRTLGNHGILIAGRRQHESLATPLRRRPVAEVDPANVIRATGHDQRPAQTIERMVGHFFHLGTRCTH